MSAEIRRAKKTFNVISVSFIDQIQRIFGGDQTTLTFIKAGLQRFAADKKEDHVPAANFFGTMNTVTALTDSEEGEKLVVGELVIRKDERLFGSEVGVTMASLETLKLRELWPQISPENKELIWDYLIRMAKCAAQVVIGLQMLEPRVQQVLQDLQKNPTLRPGSTPEELNAFKQKVRDALAEK